MSHQPPSPRRIDCPGCGKSVKLPHGALGGKFACPRCGGDIDLGPARQEPATVHAVQPSAGGLTHAARGEDSSSVESRESIPHIPPPVLPPVEKTLVECPQCGTQFAADASQVDDAALCPDCSFQSLLNQPTSDTAADIAEVPPAELETFGTLSSLLDESSAETRPAERTVPDLPEERDEGDRRYKDVMARQAEELLAKAEAGFANEDDYVRPDLPERPYIEGLLNIFADPRVLLAGIVLTLSTNVVTSLLIAVFDFGSREDKMQIMALPLIVMLGVAGFVTLVIASVSFWTLLIDTASGRKQIDGWPETNVGKWLAESLPVLLGLLLAAIPGYLFGQLFFLGGTPLWASAMIGGSMSLLVFPVVLLSIMQSGSPVVPFSKVVWSSLQTNPKPWVTCYLLSLLVLGAIALSVWLMVSTGFVVRTFFCVLLIVTLLIYFRLIGRLAWIVDESADQSDAKPGDANADK